MSVQLDYQRPSAQTLMIESAPPPFYKTLKSHHAGTMNALDFPDLGGVKRQSEFSHGLPYPSDRWSMPLTSEADFRHKEAARAASRPPETPLYSKQALPGLRRKRNPNAKRINKAVRSNSEFKGLLHLEHVGPEPDEDGPPPYAAQLVQAAVLRKMKEVRVKNPYAISQGCFVQLQGIPHKWLQRGYQEWTEAPPDLLNRLPPEN